MKPRICVAITDDNIAAIKEAEPFVDLFEVRIDLIGEGWPDLVSELKRPWIACVRNRDEGGSWAGDDSDKIEKLISAVRLGASLVDIELKTPDLKGFLAEIKPRAECILSVHELEKTSPLDELKEIVHRQLEAGADICKVVTTARSFADNLTVLKLVSGHPQIKLVSFAMGPSGITSRILSPLLGGYLTYASLSEGKESAPGQITVSQLTNIYRMLAK
jgi:3-dehydroquinate dehydratase type I